MCGSENTIEIVYGYPGPELMESAERGAVELGGCCVFPDEPDHRCRECDAEWVEGHA